MFEFNTAVHDLGLSGLGQRTLKRDLLNTHWSRRHISGGGYWETTWLPGGYTLAMFSTGDGVYFW